MNALTERQKSVYDFIAAYQSRFGYPPTLQEIAGHLKVSGNLGVARHLAALEKKGYLTRTPGSSRSIRISQPVAPAAAGDDRFSVSLPIAGTVRAGHLSPAIEDIQGHFSVDRHAARGAGCFFLRVRGDSMVDAGILEGDLALIRPQRTADNRELVVAIVDGEATLKRFFREEGRIRLQPENPAYAPIIVPAGREVEIVGKVVGLYRSLD